MSFGPLAHSPAQRPWSQPARLRPQSRGRRRSWDGAAVAAEPADGTRGAACRQRKTKTDQQADQFDGFISPPCVRIRYERIGSQVDGTFADECTRVHWVN